MAECAVSFALNQLALLLREEGQLLGGLRREVVYIQDEMVQMREFLRVAEAKEDTNTGLKEWVGQLREISYDVEDVLDKYMLRFGQHGGANGCINKAYSCIKNLKARHQIASEIKDIKYRLDNVTSGWKRYREMYADVDQGSSSSNPLKTERYDGRGEALFLDDFDVVGIEGPKKQLCEWIHSMEDGLEVISVVGMGGLGKTTLVKVYDDESVKRYFDRHVWVAVSDYKDVKDMLANLIKKLVGETNDSPPAELEGMSIYDMRNFIFELLGKDKYIIVLDDIWDIDTWEVVKFALPKRETYGCIILTTRSISIANAACISTGHIYDLKPLGIEESRELFYRKAFPKNSCPPDYLKEIAESILKRCGGLPLAIVVIGGLLATKKDRVEEWEKLNRSIPHELDEGGSLKRLRRLIYLSYDDLPYYLKYCFLYLSIYPERGLLYKTGIIRQWRAEGFVLWRQDKTIDEVADDYLNELVSRSLIQVAEREAVGEVSGVRIHDLVREYITLKSREHNIMTKCDGGEMRWPNKIRRIAIHKFTNFSMDTSKFDNLLSLVLWCSVNEEECGKIKKLISRCRILKLLHLENAPLGTFPSEFFKLCHLKYLCLRGTGIKVIPSSIKYLVNLETSDVANCNVSELPVEILRLNKLVHLFVFSQPEDEITFHYTLGVKVPRDIGNCLLALETLNAVNADEVEGVKIVREIGKLTKLRRLDIRKLKVKMGKTSALPLPS